MDYVGQRRCEYLNSLINCLFGAIGFGIGWYKQSFWLTFLWCCGGLLVSTIACVPDWPIFNRNPLSWQPAIKLPGEVDPATGQPIKDENTRCGTCVCGTAVHGIGCESHSDNQTKPPSESDVPTAAVQQEAAPQDVIAEVKVKTSRKK